MTPRRRLRGARRRLRPAIRLDDLQDAGAGRPAECRIGEIAADVVLLDLVHLHEAWRLARPPLLDERGGGRQDPLPHLRHTPPNACARLAKAPAASPPEPANRTDQLLPAFP